MIRTTENLADSIIGDLAWRRRELSEIILSVDGATGPTRQLHLRAGVALLYAHWEGYIRSCAASYVEFLDGQKLETGQLKENFVAMASAFKGKLTAVAGSNKVRFRIDLVRELRVSENSQASFSHKLIPSTESNLSFGVLSEFLLALGLDPTPYALKSKLIDESLVADRNEIAHGQHLSVDVQRFKHLHGEILGLMELFAIQITNAAVRKEYLLPVTLAS